MKKESFRSKLSSYIILSTSFLAMEVEKGSGQIIYSDFNPDVVESYGSFFFDLNNDGIADFKFSVLHDGTSSTPNSSYIGSTFSSNRVIGFDQNELLHNFDTILPAMLDAGNSIGPNDEFISEGVLFYFYKYWHWWPNGGYTNTSQLGFWINNSPSFLGLQIKINNNIYYGWARIKITNDEMTLYDYAYNAFPGQPILAGQGISNSITEINDNSFSLYPNPTIDKLNFQLPKKLLKSEIKIFDINGKLLVEQKLMNSSEEIPLPNFSSGIYFFEIRKDEKVVRKKFFVN